MDVHHWGEDSLPQAQAAQKMEVLMIRCLIQQNLQLEMFPSNVSQL